jgi:hypothetical protein
MTLKFLRGRPACTKKKYLEKPSWAKCPRSDPRGRHPRHAQGLNDVEWKISELLAAFSDMKNPYVGGIFAWSEIPSDEEAMETWDEGMQMLTFNTACSDLFIIVVLHNEPRTRQHPYRRLAAHGNLFAMHLPTGEKTDPFFVARDEARVRNWRLKTNRKQGWSDPEEKFRLRSWNGMAKKTKATFCETMQFRIVPLLEGKLKEAGGQPISIDERCKILEGCRPIISAIPVVRKDEECVLLKYQEYEGGKIRSHLASGTLFWHGPTRWMDGRIVPERKRPKRAPREMPKALAEHFRRLKELNRRADEFSERECLPEIRPILMRLDRRIASLPPPPATPDFAPKENLIEAPALIAPIPIGPRTPKEVAEMRRLRAAKKSINYEPDIGI